MSDTFREVTSTSWFGRIRRSFGGLVIGLLAVVAMVVMLFWNEGRAVTTAKSLAEGAAAVATVPADPVEPVNEGALIHVVGQVETDAVPADEAFGISQPGIRLTRTVEMYQWTETRKTETTTKLGGGEETVTTYSYAKEWSDSAVDSGEFRQPDGHVNPPKEIASARFQIPQARLGGFTLDEPVLDRIGGDEALAIGQDKLPAVRAAHGGTQKVSVLDGRIYLGQAPTAPAIGDYRISYEAAPLGMVSVVGRQAADRIGPYQTAAGDSLLMVDRGVVPADKMFSDAATANTVLTWILRLVGLFVMVVGFALFLAPIGVVGDVIPPLGSLLRMGTGLIAFLLAVLLGTGTIAVAWFYYRPLVSAIVAVAGLLVAAGIVHFGKARRAATASAPAATPLAAEPAPAPSATAARPASKWN